MTTLEIPQPPVDVLFDDAEQWRMTLKAEFAHAVRLLVEGTPVDKITPQTKALNRGEWKACLQAARNRVAQS